MAQPDETFRQALALHQAGRLAEAQMLYARVLGADARHFDSLHLMGLAKVQSGATEEGAALIRQSLAVRPGVPEACYNLGHALLTLKRPGDALDYLLLALEGNPRDAQCHFEAGNALQELKRGDEAIARYEEAIRLEPRYAEAFNNRGIALKDDGRLEEAVASYDRALALRPRYAEAHSNRGNALKEMARFEEALACHDTAIALKPDYAEAHYNRGNVLGELKRFDEALESYDRALALRPHYAEARHNKSLLLLGRGDWREGFALYPARWQTLASGGETYRGGAPRWDGRTLKGDLLLWAEQGIGDEIFHAGLLPLVPTDRMRVTLAVDKRLHAIFRRSFPQFDVIDSGALTAPMEVSHAAQAPMGDLGGILDIDAEGLGRRGPSFLRPDIARRAAIVHAPDFPKARPVVGLSWKSANKKFGAEKSLRLTDLAPVLALPGLSFVNLQYGDVTNDIADARQSLGVDIHEVAGLDLYNDIDGLMALVDACDVVVTTSNVTAHVAGSIGKKAVVMVPANRGLLWYWQGGANNLWYPSLSRVTQPRMGDWGSAIATAASWVRENT